MSKIKWQGNTPKRASHAFLSETKAGDVSLCGRESLTTGDTSSDPHGNTCGSCANKLKKLNVNT